MLIRATILTNEGAIERIEVDSARLYKAIVNTYSMSAYERYLNSGWRGPTGVVLSGTPLGVSGSCYTTGNFGFSKFEDKTVELSEKISELIKTGKPQTMKTEFGVFNMEDISEPKQIA